RSVRRRPSLPARRHGAPVSTTRRRLPAAPLLRLPGAALAACSGDAGSSAAEAAADGDGADRADEMPTVQAGEPELPVTVTGDDGVEITVEGLERVMVVDDGTIELTGALGRADLPGIAPEGALLENVAS